MKYGFAAALVDHLEKWPKTRLVVIDTMAWIRDEYEKNTDHRAQDHLFGKALLGVAHRFGVTILVNHHFTKGVSEDFLEDISGTTSLTAIANVILGLARARGASEGVLKVTGRKVADRDIRLEFRNLQWYRDDIGEEMDDATDEFEVAAYLVEKAAGEVRRLDDISSATGIPKPRLVKVLKRLEGTQVQRVTYGKYRGLLPEAA
jgi:hypothetical protein